jgi:TonB family protein
MITAAWPPMVPRRGAVEVQVRVHVDATGKVVRATPVQRTVANYEFVNSATAAAMSWLFVPAKDNGRPVASEAVLTFKFRP